jgi:NitT/TauT family transport system permease protein
MESRMGSRDKEFEAALVQSESPAAAAPLQAKIAARRQIPDAALSTLSVILLLVIWTGITSSGLIRPGYFPSPLELGREFDLLLREGYKDTSLFGHIGISLFRTAIGFTLGVLLGVPLGLLTGYSRISSAMVSPIMAFIRPIPPIAFIPMAVLYFGLGELGKVVLIFWTSFVYVHVNAHAGAAHVPIAYLRAARSLGLSRSDVFFRIILPAAIPQIFTGLKVAMALSWAVVVAAELTGAQSGLGYMISDAALIFRIPVVFIGIALIGVIGLALYGILNFLEARFVHWRGR